MRCPKCHYLSFDPEPRCRNCGYGLSLEDDDLFIRDENDAPASPFADVNLRAGAVEPPPPAPPVPRAAAASVRTAAPPTASTSTSAQTSSPFAGLSAQGDAPSATDVSLEERAAVQLPPSPARSRPAPTTELPLFVKGMSGSASAAAARVVVDDPLAQFLEDARPPLAVRRTMPEPVQAPPKPARPAPEPRGKGPLDRDLLADLQPSDALGELQARARRAAASISETVATAGAGPRLAAATIDGVLLGSLSAGVMWLTLRWCGLPLDRALMLPVLIPTSVFLSMVGVGYLVLFNAAGGQTLGKMAVGLRVVREITPVDAGGPVSLGQATVRALLTLPSVLVAGAGFLPALFGEHRGVHDRLAHTRVVRA